MYRSFQIEKLLRCCARHNFFGLDLIYRNKMSIVLSLFCARKPWPATALDAFNTSKTNFWEALQAPPPPPTPSEPREHAVVRSTQKVVVQ